MKDQIYLNYVGRFVYSFRNSSHKPNKGEPKPDGEKYFPINGKVKKFEVSIEENLFRKKEQKLYGQTDRSFEHEVEDIADAIILKRLIDRSIFYEIELIGEKNICHSTYTNSFKFRNFTSNIEDHYFSKNGLHITKVGSLSSYAQIDFDCFDTLNNNSIKYILTNGQYDKKIVVDNEISYKMSQMVSLFLCETSRNPASFITIPMILELSEWIYNLNKSIADEDQKIVSSLIESVHKNSNYYNEFIKEKKLLEKKIAQKALNSIEENKTKNTLKKITIDIQEKFLDLSDIGGDIPKSKIVKDFILNLFPLAIEKAVQGCRYINNIISNKVTEEGRCYHRYDKDEGAVKEAKFILSIEKNLISMYKKYLEYNKQDTDDMLTTFNDLAKEWYCVSIREPDKDDEELVLVGEALDPLLS